MELIAIVFIAFPACSRVVGRMGRRHDYPQLSGRGALAEMVGDIDHQLPGNLDFDSRSFDDMMRRSLRLLDAGLIIAVGDGIARANRWIGDHTGCPLPARSRRRWVRVVTNRQAAG